MMSDSTRTAGLQALGVLRVRCPAPIAPWAMAEGGDGAARLRFGAFWCQLARACCAIDVCLSVRGGGVRVLDPGRSRCDGRVGATRCADAVEHDCQLVTAALRHRRGGRVAVRLSLKSERVDALGALDQVLQTAPLEAVGKLLGYV